ncbi:hypothetical protein E2F43_02445 [Seongchinamella unica]|uniref:Uncharacterized protein n=1 Tax=Seongchinamella unica TaxID=2547392 RepID=A0A4R5LUL6_9GAMM|nr:hypothetical protein [Seongchinamella unica]TDG15116.1 hypothetical protein E2F43_02445 [Seongchinamella unica]
MNVNFKPLGLAAAVAAASAGYAGAVSAQATVASETELGDLAIVPYYTVMDGYATGVNIINTSDQTQVLKFRFRRAVDSMDALDFNVVLSPQDVYTGFIGLDGDDITWTSNDNSCTAPDYNTGDNKFTMPPIYREGAETGYIEIISMGSPDSETAPIAKAAKHGADGVPANCDDVRDNFFANVLGTGVADLTDRGVIDSETTHQFTTTAAGEVLEATSYVASADSLKVSYFIKSDETGVEFGDNAIHIAGFMDGPAMTNQQQGIFSGDFQGFDHPDLNGGAPLDFVTGAAGTPRGKYNELRAILGTEALINDWSKNTIEALGATVDTDWVVTIPGQYTMLALGAYLTEGPDACLRQTAADIANAANPTSPVGDVVPCDFRDIPLTATFDVYDREEQGIVVEEGDLVVSPQPPVISTPKALKDEVNVIQWGESPVLNAPVTISVDTPDGAKFGWASLSTEPADSNLMICDIDFNAQAYNCMDRAIGDTPIVGFVAWQRAFAANPGSNYGRIVEHSRVQSAP